MDITRIALLSVVALLLLPATAHAQGKAAHKDAYLYFVWPQDGTVIKGAFWARFGLRNMRWLTQWARDLVRKFGVRPASTTIAAGMLSGGNQQKVIVARLLHQDADILLLDEPTRGIDIGSKAQVYETIAECARQNKAILMVSSYLPELFGMCDRLAVMSRGHLTEAKPIDQWTPESVLQAAIGSEA